MTTGLPGRNRPVGFAERTRRNLFLVRDNDHRSDVHLITQVILSLLGILVFPLEKRSIQKAWEEDLEQERFDHPPDWDVVIDTYETKTKTLKILARHVRNAVAHNAVEFSSDSKTLEDVVITFKDTRKREGHSRENWKARIRSDYLLKLCLDLLERLEALEGGPQPT